MADLKRLDRSQVGLVTDAVVRAFERDPIWVAMFPDPARRASGTRALFGFMLRYGALRGEAWATGGFEGAAVWLDDSAAGVGGWAALRAGALALPFRVGMGVMARMAGMGRAVTGLRDECCPKPFRYLAMLGIAPGHQGRGLGSALMRPMLERCDREGLPTWLETETERNVGFYRGFGFEVARELVVPGLEVKLWGMKREPRAENPGTGTGGQGT